MSSSGVAQKGILANRVAVVTGSTDGIGLAIARRLAQDGAHVVVSSRKQQNVDRAVAMLQGEGLSVTGTVCHVGKAEDRERLVAKLWSKQQKQSTKRLTLCPLPPRIGQPEDCAGLVSFLCSSDASYISGENIAVAGFSSRL
ncbi:PREDICTED: dehydrogenase/reductase SDR family member 2, mitochondrial-like isoform X3 [Propithecus coquereli]|uniref:dehydrogenase/reductase SDR family member 2, mitochondrial-like isoform X3 n=1 Tax=Propithecus coquereli TaxID=379532 RepID=UPI00063F7E02|nr:PREDICTED: dehydrogenase/reductase SDR family member 2, mitochondrial-like isoform X3 [Propithecus coquereli]